MEVGGEMSCLASTTGVWSTLASSSGLHGASVLAPVRQTCFWPTSAP